VKQADPNRSREKRRHWPVLLAVVALLSWLALALVASYSQVKPSQPPTGGPKGPAPAAKVTPASRLSELALKDTAWDPAWQPLPGAGKPAQPIKKVRAMYAFAARHPEVLQYAPCYCGCESGGHTSVNDCFVKSRDANGLPQWDGMGFI